MARGRAILALVILGTGACTRRSPPPPAPADAGPSAAVLVEAAARPTVPLGRVGDGRTGSTVVLAQWSDRPIAFVADEDDHALRAIDVETARELSVTPLPSRPAQLLVTADGRLLVAMRDDGVLASFRATDDLSAPLVAGAHTDT